MTEYARSGDGTRIAWEASGQGPALVLVHGTGDTGGRWAAVSGLLGRHFRLYAMDRRGHGKSGDASRYAFEREFEDVASVVTAAAAQRPTGEPVYLLGHSFGGICALEAAERWHGVAKLVLYEPPIPVAEEPLGAREFLQRVEHRLEAGDDESAWELFLTEVMRIPQAELGRLRLSPGWAEHVATARVLPREARARERYRFDPERLRSLRVPTLLLSGSESPPPLQAATRALAETLPLASVRVLRGQGHGAISMAPEAFAQAVVEFLQGPPGASGTADSATSPRRASRRLRSSAARS